jgi:hypothetical protein
MDDFELQVRVGGWLVVKLFFNPHLAIIKQFLQLKTVAKMQ